MTPPGTPLEITESRTDGVVRLSLSGELDLDSAPMLDDRLTRLRARKASVRLDLSRLQFIDSTGLHLLIRAFGDAKIDGWELQMEPQLGQEVARLFRMVHLDHLIMGGGSPDG